MKATRHFLSLMDFTPQQLKQLIMRAIEMKRESDNTSLKNKTLAMIFEKSSTRTRVAFETAMIKLGGHAIFLSKHDTQIGRGETIEDSARVLSGMVDGIMIRTFEHERAEQLRQHSTVPVINGLTDRFHPCQLLADMLTYYEHRGSIAGRHVAWIGDGNNMCHSYINAARQFDFELRIACPSGYEPDTELITQADGRVRMESSSQAAAENACLVVTDVWASMGDEDEKQVRREHFAKYQVDGKVMACAAKDALFMHCLPAHRGEEVSAEVIDSDQSVVWEEATNRLHAQKALLENLLV